VGVRTYETGDDRRPRARGPTVAAASLLGLLVLAGLLVNGRPMGGLPSPLTFGLDATGGALAGMFLASTSCAAAAAFVFMTVGQRRPLDDARTAAWLFAFGTTVWATAHSFSSTPFSTMLVAAALFQLVRAEDDEAEGPRAGLPLALAVALQPADLALAAILVLFAVVRRPRQAGLLALWSMPGIAIALGLFMTAAPGSPMGFDAGWAPRLAALWVSPVTGILVFAPVVLVGLVGLATSLRREDASLAAACGAAFVAHGLILAAHPLVGGTWGPQGWTDALPLCIVFLPEGLDRLKGAGTVLAFLSVAVQALGVFTYDGRWDRVVAPTPEKRAAVLWDVPRGPIPFAISERALTFAMPRLHDGKLLSAEHLIVLGASEGSRISATADHLVVEGADPTFGNVHLQGGAQLQGDRIRLESPGDAVFFRVREASRLRHLEIRVVGRGRGTLTVEEASFWSPTPRVRARVVAGEFRWTLPYEYAASGGGDLRVCLRSAGNVLLASIRLVAPTEPDNVIRLQGAPDR